MNNRTEFTNPLARIAIMKNQMGQGYMFSRAQRKPNKFKLFCLALQRHGLHTLSVKESWGTWAKRHIWNKQCSFAVCLQFASHRLGVPGRSQELPQQMCCTHSQSRQPCPALAAQLMPGQEAGAFPDTQPVCPAGEALLSTWFSCHRSMRDTVNSRSITTLRYTNPTWLEMLYFVWRGINNTHFTCN